MFAWTREYLCITMNDSSGTVLIKLASQSGIQQRTSTGIYGLNSTTQVRAMRCWYCLLGGYVVSLHFITRAEKSPGSTGGDYDHVHQRPLFPGLEPTPDLQNPTFSNCTIPIILWARNLYNYAHFWGDTLAWLAPALDRVTAYYDNLQVVVATPYALQFPAHARNLLQPYSKLPVRTLASFSDRGNAKDRCFSSLFVCVARGPTVPAWPAGQVYVKRLRESSVVLRTKSKRLEVVFAVRFSKHRQISNLAELLAECNGAAALRLNATSEVSVHCTAHVFGDDLKRDVDVAATADVLVGIHGANLANAFMLRAGASLLEIQPNEFCCAWYSYHAQPTSSYNQLFYWIVYLASPKFTTVSPLQGRWNINKNVTVPWHILKETLQTIGSVGQDKASYVQKYNDGEHYLAASESGIAKFDVQNMMCCYGKHTSDRPKNHSISNV
jgi:Glycosyltransferase 61